jgi:hypothetical protein
MSLVPGDAELVVFERRVAGADTEATVFGGK